MGGGVKAAGFMGNPVSRLSLSDLKNAGIETPDLKHFSFCRPYSAGE